MLCRSVDVVDANDDINDNGGVLTHCWSLVQNSESYSDVFSVSIVDLKHGKFTKYYLYQLAILPVPTISICFT